MTDPKKLIIIYDPKGHNIPGVVFVVQKERVFSGSMSFKNLCDALSDSMADDDGHKPEPTYEVARDDEWKP